MKNASLQCLAGLLAMIWSPALAVVVPPVHEGFETNTAGSALVGLTNQGWSASAYSVLVASSNSMAMTVPGGTNVVAIPMGTVLSNLVVSVSPSVIWVDFQKRQMLEQGLDEASLTVDSNAAVQVFLTTNRTIWFYDRLNVQWTNLVTDCQGTNVAAFSTGDWTRVSIFENFASNKAAIFLDGHLIRDQIAFITNRSSFAGFSFENGASGTNYLDEVYVWTNVPIGLTVDLDNDTLADAQEIQTYGNLSTWRPWPHTVATNGTGRGTVSPPVGTYVTNGTAITVNYTFQAAAGSGINSVMTNGVSCPYTGDAKTGTCPWTIPAGGIFTVVFDTKNVWTVPSDLGTITGAVASAVAGDTLVISNGMQATDLILDKPLTLIGTNVTITGTLMVNEGVTNVLNIATNWSVTAGQVGTNASLIVSNSTVTFSTLAISTGGVVRVVNGTVTANGITLNGDFTLDSNWGHGLTSAPLNFLDTFERYGAGTRLDALGTFGWGASSSGVMVQVATTYGGSGRAVEVPASATVSNAIDSKSGQTNIWTDLWLNESDYVIEVLPPVVDSNASAQVCLTAGKLLAVYHDGGWDVCSNDAVNVSATNLYLGGWARITLNQNYGTKRSAIFLNGRLLRENVLFINTNLTLCGGLRVMGGTESPAYLDNVSLATNVPAEFNSLAYDADRDGIPDVREIHSSGTLLAWPLGAVFKMR